MISWIKYKNQKSIAESGEISLEPATLEKIITNPWSAISSYGHQIGLHDRKNSVKIFAWAPYQQIILANTLNIVTEDQIDQIPVNMFWDTILRYMKQVRDLLEDDVDDEIGRYLGYYGYFGYELSRLLDQYQHRSDDPGYPHLVLDFPTRLVVQGDTLSYYIEVNLPALSNPEFSVDAVNIPETGMIHHGTSYDKYISDLKSIIDHIEKGDIYQANYTQQFSLKSSQDILELYQNIIRAQELPHAAYLNYGELRVMSLSPELFLQIHEGHVITKPIKGTRPRGITTKADQKQINDLKQSIKDQAELAMIVDLLRNDLGKSAYPGSVEVDQHANVETYENVHHLVSTVSARLDSTLEASWRLLLRAFPGGSISGVPKLRAMEIIEAHESLPRGIYTGNIGFIGLDGTLDLNIAIRTAIISKQQVIFNAGGGIVYDSNPVEEYLESLHKAKHLAQYFNHNFVGHLVSLDGHFQVSDQLKLKPGKLGVFETILVDHGHPVRLASHLSRLERGLHYYDLKQLSCPTQKDLEQFLRLNLATSGLNRLNIYAWRDLSTNEEHLLVKVSRYNPPTGSLRLLLPSSPISVPTAIQQGLKSLDYEIYRQATQNAAQHHCWDSMLYTSDERLLEGGRCSLFVYKDDTWLTPRRDIVDSTVKQYLVDNHVVTPADIYLEDLDQIDAIAVGNALIQVIPVQFIQSPDGSILWQSQSSSKVKELTTVLNKTVWK